jgi:mRNA interferase MazF
MNAPERGDLVWLDLDPQPGQEQAGRGPALVLTPARYNRLVGLLIACPVTNHAKGNPFESPLPADLAVRGVVLADQVRSLDWRARRAEFICKSPTDLLEDVTAKVQALVGDEG